jgi:hypothetical protein
VTVEYPFHEKIVPQSDSQVETNKSAGTDPTVTATSGPDRLLNQRRTKSRAGSSQKKPIANKAMRAGVAGLPPPCATGARCFIGPNSWTFQPPSEVRSKFAPHGEIKMVKRPNLRHDTQIPPCAGSGLEEPAVEQRLCASLDFGGFAGHAGSNQEETRRNSSHQPAWHAYCVVMIDGPTGRDNMSATPERELLPEKIHFLTGDIS